jgi:hypothetical protein
MDYLLLASYSKDWACTEPERSASVISAGIRVQYEVQSFSVSW